MNQTVNNEKLLPGAGICTLSQHDDSTDSLQWWFEEMSRISTQLWEGLLKSDLFNTTQEANVKQHTYKLTILYDNGKEYKVNGVTAHYIDNDLPGNVRTLVYNHYNKATKASIRTQIPARDIAALTVKKPDQIIVTKLKPCARISGKAEKK